ncbi:hypothetical protein [Ruegeria sp. SCP11]|uniref:hypothetical protein n=1 Tax=Ruegeria sp. SCP11 TaxID=3141378 RepID=UPI00333D3D5D
MHIGTEKTGTTSLQHYLAQNRSELRSNGVLLPKTAGPANHTRLVAASLDDGVIDNVKAHIMASRGEGEARLRENFAEEFSHELTEGSDWNTLLLTSELIHSRLHTPSEITRLFSYFEDHVAEVQIVAVLRRQDELAASRFSTAIRAGHTGFDDVFGDLHDHAYLALPDERQISDFVHYYDYAALLRRFVGRVPADHIHVWLYEYGGQKLESSTQLAKLLGTPLAKAEDSPNLNSAMSFAAQYLIATLNTERHSHLPSGARNKAYVDLKRKIEAEVTGARRQITRSDAAAFLARFSDSNAEVATMLGRETLFDEDVSRYPRTAHNNLPDDIENTLAHYRSFQITSKKPNALKRLKQLMFS